MATKKAPTLPAVKRKKTPTPLGIPADQMYVTQREVEAANPCAGGYRGALRDMRATPILGGRFDYMTLDLPKPRTHRYTPDTKIPLATVLRLVGYDRLTWVFHNVNRLSALAKNAKYDDRVTIAAWKAKLKALERAEVAAEKAYCKAQRQMDKATDTRWTFEQTSVEGPVAKAINFIKASAKAAKAEKV